MLYLTNFNFHVFFTMSCRLEEVVDTIIADAEDKMLSCIYFLYRGENICLQWKSDMLPLVQNYGELSSFMLELVRAWLNPQLYDVKSHMTVPYSSTLLMQSVEEAERDGLDVFVDLFCTISTVSCRS